MHTMIIDQISSLGGFTIRVIQILGRSVLFLLTSLYYGITPPYRFSRVIQQVEFIGAKSFFIVFITAIFTGMVLGLQGYYTLRKFGAVEMLGSAVSLSIIRELGPVLCALMVTGRAGSAITAEIGIMKLTSQVTALDMMAINPVRYIVSPKILAAIISIPLLTAFFDIIGILGGYLVGVGLLGVNEGAYFGEMKRAVEFEDIYGGVIKSISFGLIIAWLCSYKGYESAPTTEGVSKATTDAVVITSVIILASDYVLTSLLL
jgi:phospholipid/cholesterol/gamma-HCH transport system permease protein